MTHSPLTPAARGRKLTAAHRRLVEALEYLDAVHDDYLSSPGLSIEERVHWRETIGAADDVSRAARNIADVLAS